MNKKKKTPKILINQKIEKKTGNFEPVLTDPSDEEKRIIVSNSSLDAKIDFAKRGLEEYKDYLLEESMKEVE